MKKDVCIVTMTGYSNYGNRLQNYALDKVCSKLGCNVKTLWPKTSFRDKLKNTIKYFVPERKTEQIRYNKFKKFTNKYMNKNAIVYNENNFKLQNDKFDYFIVGSDQVWNYNYLTKCKQDGSFYLYFLNFSDKNKNIAYAPSLGTGNVDKEYLNEYKNGLSNFKSLSCREDVGKKIIKDISNKEVEVVLDPTMLLSPEEWNNIAKKPKQLQSEKYILNYFLGEIPSQWKNEIERIAKENKCEIINILDKNSPFYITDPSEFLYLEKNAFSIFTDSFHSSVFAIIYNVPFVVFDRQQQNLEIMNSRIDTLLTKFNLENRRFKDKITNDLLKSDYMQANKILENQKEKSIEFLKNALDIK